ncbi:MAG: PatB family C-S lyase [Deltaproteobacteria bacterium]|nr:PatB family C-S lyase [Deltaproteobacteria bacterium]MBW2386915.1 PatB family C-S lyase [Deltaproteobacteria bacterium]
MTSEAPADSAIRQTFDSLRAEELWRSQRIKWRLFGDDVLPAWVADMDFPVAAPIQRALAELLSRSDLGYHHVPLSPQLREALVSRMAERFDWQVEPSRVVPLVNVVQGLDASVMLHSRPGEGVIVQTPIYPPFLAAVEKSGRQLVENPLVPSAARYEIDFDRLRADVRPDTRVFLLCNPHNPTGRAFEVSELAELAEFAEENDLIVVSDEIHADLIYPGHRHIPFASLGPEVAERTITLTAATKAFNLAGLPCAFAIFGSDRTQQPFDDLPPHLLGHCGIMDDVATFTAWTEGQAWQDEVQAYLLENRRTVIDFFSRRLPSIRLLPPEATYLAWLDCRELDVANPFAFFLKRGRVALSSGRDFGPPGEGFLRLNFATSASILGDILERMAVAVAERDE